ncbi:uncharacterized protein M6B38_393615 [Iris pallida]|uniref:Integrase catalytic domain-containing protein n=1 Tax=Iris pallida TaxID=29817 RepID=A0AAX6FY65_IRIPA|nr:uncharacterized protein M6B38_393615 [Iris pallida]
MTGDASLFTTLSKMNKEGYVSFGNNLRGYIIGIGDIGKAPYPVIKDVCLVTELKHNLPSISHLADHGYGINFVKDKCTIIDSSTGSTIFEGIREDNIYVFYLLEDANTAGRCLMAKSIESQLWHMRLGHANMDTISRLSTKKLVRGLPDISFKKDTVFSECEKNKATKSAFKSKNAVSTTRPLQLLHMDLFGPSRIASLGGKLYAFVIMDNFSRYTWVYFLARKNDVLSEFVTFYNKVQNEKGFMITRIHSDHGGEFENAEFKQFCDTHGYLHEFSCPRTPQQNGVMERKNITLSEMARVMLN